MKYLIVGLGNIGSEYKNTRHNIGFKILDALASASNIFFSPNRYADTASYKFKGRTFILIKPNTYMNLSGKAVNYYLQKEKVDVQNLLVLVDDISLPFGALRLRKKGSSGGHNGLQHIIETINTQNYPRLKFGIGNEFSKAQMVNYVLGEWTAEENEMLDERIKKAVEIIKSFGTIGMDKTMTSYNNK